MTFTHALSTNNYGEYKFIVDSNPANGTHTTIASAISAASSGEDIFVRAGTYSEDITLKAGVNLVASQGDNKGNAVIDGKITHNTAGFCSLCFFDLTNTGDNIIEVSGTAASGLEMTNCILTTVDTTAISFTSSDSGAAVTLRYGAIVVGDTGHTTFSKTSAGTLNFDHVAVTNSGGSSTAATSSAGSVFLTGDNSTVPISISGTSSITLTSYLISTSAQNVTALTINTSGTVVAQGVVELRGGTATALVITSGTFTVPRLTINSSNANAISGAGTIQYGVITYTGSSSTNSVTTQTELVTQPPIPPEAAFSAYLGTTDSNVTGDGTVFTLGTGNALTEVIDKGADFVPSTGVFTAPTTGRYYFTGCVWLQNPVGNTAQIQLVTSNRSYRGDVSDPTAIQEGTSSLAGYIISAYVDMDAADTAKCTIQNSGGAKTADVFGNANPGTYFQGYRL